MTTEVDMAVDQGSEERTERAIFLALGAALLAALLITPFLPEGVAADNAARVFLLLLVLISGIDVATRRVPNALVYPSIAFGLVVTAVIDPGLLPAALAGGGAAFGVMLVLAIIQRGAMGMGDVKAACFSGCILGIKGGVFSLLFGFAVAGLVALPLVLFRLRDRKDTFPLAPFLVVGALLSYNFWGFVIPGSF